MRGLLPAFSVRRPVTVAMAFLALCVLGSIARSRIAIEAWPTEFEAPWMWMWMPYEAGSPEEALDEIIRPVEDQLSTVPGIKHLHSRAGETSASVGMEFHSSVDMVEAYNAVVDRIERVRPDLPEYIRKIYVRRYNPNEEPVIWAGMTLPDALSEPARVIDEIVVKRLERLEGVAQVEAWGTQNKKIFVDFDREAVSALGVDLYRVMTQLYQDNFQLSGGVVEEAGQLLFVRSMSRYASLDDLRQTPVGEGVVLADIAQVSHYAESPTRLRRVNGQPGAGIEVHKESSANTVEICAAVRACFLELQQDPRLAGMEFFLFMDSGEMIEESIDNLQITALYGGLLAVLVLYFFLRDLRMTLLIAGVIPMSLLITVTALYFKGSSLNLFSMMGMMVAVGMVVDSAIVVVENIYNKRRQGKNATEAAVKGTSEVSMAILLSTATTLVVFLPMILMPEDVMSRYFLGELGFPVCFAIASSLLVALLFTPLSTVWFGERGTRTESRWLVWMSLRYERILGWILGRRFDTFLGVAGLILVTVLLPGQAVSCSESSENFWGDFEVEFSLDESMGMDDGLAIVEEVENIVEAHREAWGVRVHRGSYHGSSNWGHILVYLDEDKATGPKESLLDELEAALPEYPGVELSVERQERGGDPRTNRIELEIRGDDSRVMMELHEEVARRLTASPLILTARHDLEEEGGTELRLHLDRDAMEDRGMSAASVGPVLSFAMRGRELPRYWEGEWEVPVLARFEAQDRWSLEKLLDFQLGEDGATPLRAVVRTEVAPSAHRIVRSNRISALSVVVSMAEEVDREEGYAAIAAALNDMEFPQGYSWSLDNDQWDYANSDDAQKKAMILSVVLVFLLMGVLFESFLLPFCILFTIPMAFLGVFWTLYIVGANLDEMASVGLVVLVGVVVNNGIVLVDMVTQQRRQGVERREALRIAGRRRMRPILMTAMTTIMGLLPMAVGKQNLLGMPYASLAWVVIGGLTTGTVLTLFFLPLVYDALDDMRSVWSRFWGYAWSGSRKAS